MRIVGRCSARVRVCASWNRSKYGKSSLVYRKGCVHAYVCIYIKYIYTCVCACVCERCRQIGIPPAGPMEVQHFIQMSHTRCTGPRPGGNDEDDVHVVS